MIPNKIASAPARRNRGAAQIQETLTWALCALYVAGCTLSEDDATTTTVTADAGTACEFGAFEYRAWRYDDEGDCFADTFEYFSGCAREGDYQEDGYLVCDEAIGYAIAADGTCWSFPNLCFPVGWTDITFSLDTPEVEHPCRVREIGGEGGICGTFVPDASAPASDAGLDGGGNRVQEQSG